MVVACWNIQFNGEMLSKIENRRNNERNLLMSHVDPKVKSKIINYKLNRPQLSSCRQR